MTRWVEIRGYAVPYQQGADCRGVREQFCSGAFRAQLKGNPAVGVNAYDHDRRWFANSIDGTAQFFEDRYGLAFSAWLDADRPEQRRILYDVETGDLSFASVGLADVDDVAAGSTRVVARASLDHVTVCDGAAIYQQTGVWLAEKNSSYLPRMELTQLAARWAVGRVAADFRQRAIAALRAERTPIWNPLAMYRRGEIVQYGFRAFERLCSGSNGVPGQSPEAWDFIRAL